MLIESFRIHIRCSFSDLMKSTAVGESLSTNATTVLFQRKTTLLLQETTEWETYIKFLWIYWEMFNFVDEISTILNKGWSLATVNLKNFTDEFVSVVCCCATSWNHGVHRHVDFVDFRKTIKSCSWRIGAMRS